MTGRLFVVAGPSGVGKSTLEKPLLAEVTGLSYSVSATTRPPRPGEEPGRDYFFVSAGEFDRMIEAGELLEWAEFYGHRYGTPARFVEAGLAQGRDLLIDVEVEGLAQLRRWFGQAIYILILPPSLAALKERLLRRQTEDARGVAARLERAVYELKRLAELIEAHNPEHRPGQEYLIINDDLDRAYQDLKAVILACRLADSLGPARRLDFLKSLAAEAG